MPKLTLTAVPAPEIQERHRAWATGAAEKAKQARKVRLDRLRGRRDAVQRGVALLREEQGQLGVTAVTLRQGLFARLGEPEALAIDPDLSTHLPPDRRGDLAGVIRARRERRAPLGRLVHRPGAAVPLLVSALGVAGFRGLPGEPVDLSDVPNVGRSSWSKIIGDGDRPDVARRHVVDAVKRLRGEDLVRLRGPLSARPGYTGWGLLSEEGTGSAYTVADLGLVLPHTLWTNGWVALLSPPELLAYLMVRHVARLLPAAHSDRGVSVAPSVRTSTYGVTKTTYATLNELEEFGLVRRTTSRRAVAQGEESPREVDRFQIVRNGLDRDALDVVSAVLSASPTPMRALRYDPMAQLGRELSGVVPRLTKPTGASPPTRTTSS